MWLNFIKSFVPKTFRIYFKSIYIFSEIYNHRKYIFSNYNLQVPWYTYSCVEFLESFDFSNFSILEFGSGASTYWWSKRCKKIYSIEHDIQYYNDILNLSYNNNEIYLSSNKINYIHNSFTENDIYDIIIIDGMYREDCAKLIKTNFQNFQFVILDNSDRYPDLCSYFRNECKLLQIDFNGFGPINSYTWTTSFFYNKNNSMNNFYLNNPSFSKGKIL